MIDFIITNLFPLLSSINFVSKWFGKIYCYKPQTV